METARRTIKINTCNRCGYKMVQKGEHPPRYCANPHCHSPYWNRKRVYKLKRLEKEREAYA